MIPVDERIGTYGGLTAIGQGTFASVYRAWQPTFEREVAVKLLSQSPDGEAIGRFRRECAAIGALSGHPNIVTVFDVGTSETGSPYIVMELLSGGSLADHISSAGPLPWDEVLSIGVKLAGAIESAHRAGVLHLDVKPENVLVSRYGEPKLADFGLAQMRDADRDAGDLVWATPVHAAPEVLAGEAPTTAADVYSLASTLHHLAAGRPPYAPNGERDAASMPVRVAVRKPPDLRPLGVPDGMCRVLERGLAKNPADRQTSAAQLGRQLQAVQVAAGLTTTPLPLEVDDGPDDEAGPPVHPLVAPAPMPAPKRRRRRGSALAVGGGVLLMVVALADFLAPATVVHHRPLPQVYADNFDAPAGWYQQDDEQATFAYDPGRYRMVVKQSRRHAISNTAPRGPVYGANLAALGDVSVRVSAHPVSGTGLFGLVCRREGGTGAFYEALVGADQSVRIVKYDGSRFVTLTHGIRPQLRADQALRLRFDCFGDSSETHLALFADGVHLAQATDRNGLSRGSTGLVLASADAASAEVAFDDFVVMAAIH